MTHASDTAPFVFHTDPGHGWLAVAPAHLDELGLRPEDFSRYSYRAHDGSRFYLEEDVDAPRFADAWCRRHGAEPDAVHAHTDSDSFIRRLGPIH